MKPENIKIVRLMKAQQMGADPVESVEIIISKEFPRLVPGVSLEKVAEAHDANAEILFRAIIETLPGGTIDRLAYKMIRHQASLYVVTHKKAGGKKMIRGKR